VHRTSYTVAFKCKVLTALIKLETEQVLFPQTVLRLGHPGVSAKNISESSHRAFFMLTLNSLRILSILHRVKICYAWVE